MRLAPGWLVLAALAAAAPAAQARVWGMGGQVLTPSTPGVEGGANADQLFGGALASGDFDGDGFADLAVGAPGETVGGIAHAGAVHVFYGSPAGFGVSDDQRIVQGEGGVPGILQSDDRFGGALAVADFNGDGYDDLAIGDPDEGIAGQPLAGAVWVIYGSNAGLALASADELDESSAGVPGTPQEGGELGHALVGGDFNHDGYDDLAIGEPGNASVDCNSADVNQPGRVLVLFGFQNGLSASGVEAFDGRVVLNRLDCRSRFGWSLAAGKLDGDHFADLAIGAPFETVIDNGIQIDAGAVFVVPGSPSGPTAVGATLWTQGAPVPGSPEADDFFGLALTVGNFDGDAYDDLVVGVPSEDLPGATNTGALVVLYGTNGGITAAGSLLIDQDTAGVSGTAESSDSFASALAAGDFDHDGFDDLAVGVPLEGLGSPEISNAGTVHVFAGSASGLTVAGDQRRDRDQPGIALSPGSGEFLGDALAAGDFTGDGVTDLVVGVPGQDDGALDQVGAIQLLRGALFAAGFEDGDTAEWSLKSP